MSVKANMDFCGSIGAQGRVFGSKGVAGCKNPIKQVKPLMGRGLY
ncbi:hypothetical protein [Mucilaginibacter sp.]|nr:hypothetical protein [Mucilaginibacter sp.]MDR3693507.1 hypothetical protein [Mucilaginibacter sp.]